MSRRVRWLAIATGCFTAAAGCLSLGWYFAILPICLVAGAIVQPRSPRPGRWLIWAAAFLLSLMVLPIGIGVLVMGAESMRSYSDFNLFGIVELWVASTLLIGCCDGALLLDAVRSRRGRPASAEPAAGVGEWIVRLAAVSLSLWLLPASVLGLSVFRRHRRADLFWTSLAVGLVIVLLDLALVMLAFRRKSPTIR